MKQGIKADNDALVFSFQSEMTAAVYPDGFFLAFSRALTNLLLIGPHSLTNQNAIILLVRWGRRKKKHSTVHNLQERNISNRSTALFLFIGTSMYRTGNVYREACIDGQCWRNVRVGPSPLKVASRARGAASITSSALSRR